MSVWVTVNSAFPFGRRNCSTTGKTLLAWAGRKEHNWRMSAVLEQKALQQLRCHHPLVIEGMSGYDPRDPLAVASVIVRQLADRWLINPPPKPVLLVTQGDPYEERGISAITRLVADELDIFRALIVLDADIADYHSPNADRYKNICEISYSTLAHVLQADMPDALTTIEAGVDVSLIEKDERRAVEGKPPLQHYYRDFALLQEVTKVACKQICGGLTVAHTSREISDFSVSSFYRVGLDSGLINANEIVQFGDEPDQPAGAGLGPTR